MSEQITKLGRDIAYRRVSTKHLGQKTDRQLFNTGIHFDLEFEDKETGKSALKRKQFNDMLAQVVAGDVIHFQSNDRCFRNTVEMLRFVETMVAKGVAVRFHTEGLDFGLDTDPMKGAMSKLVLTSMASLSEFFLTNLNVASKQGIAAAQARGVKFGRASPNYGMNSGNGQKAVESVLEARREQAKAKTEYVVPHIHTALKYLGKRPTQAKVAQFLNDANVPTPNGKNVWTQSAVCRILDKHNINLFA